MQVNSLNQVNLIGRIGQDPESKFAKSGTAVTNFSLATNEKFKDKDAKTEWHRCVVFGDSAERFGEWVSKGQLVSIVGKLRTDSWETDAGEKRYSTSVIVENWTTLSKGEKKDTVHDTVHEDKDDDLPF